MNIYLLSAKKITVEIMKDQLHYTCQSERRNEIHKKKSNKCKIINRGTNTYESVDESTQ